MAKIIKKYLKTKGEIKLNTKFEEENLHLNLLYNSSIKRSILRRIFSFFTQLTFIPDNRAGWIPFAVFEGVKLIKKEKIDIIYSICQPATSHIIALMLKKFTKKPWVADYKDAWTIDSLRFSDKINIRKKIEGFLEDKVIKNADLIIGMTEPYTNAFRAKYCSINPQKFLTITSGYDKADFEDLRVDPNNKFTMTYTASKLITASYTPEYFLIALSNVIKRNKDIKDNIIVRFVGYHMEVDRLVEKLGLQKLVEFVPYSYHRNAIRYVLQSDLLLLILSSHKWNMVKYTTKIFDYMASKKPIFAMVPKNSAVANLIKSLKIGYIVEPENIEEIERNLLNCYKLYKNGVLKCNVDNNDLERFERKHLTGILARAFNTLVE